MDKLQQEKILSAFPKAESGNKVREVFPEMVSREGLEMTLYRTGLNELWEESRS